MNREKFFDLFCEYRPKILFRNHECYFCSKEIDKMLIVKKNEEEYSWYYICKQCFCTIPRFFWIRLGTSKIDRFGGKRNE